MIEIKNLNKYFNDQKVLDDISVHVNTGEIFAIVGHSGAGKSTLLRCINGLESYSEGSLSVLGKEVKELNESELSALRSHIGMIFQNFSLLNQKNVYDNIALPMKVWGYGKEAIQKRVDELLTLIGLEHKKFAYPKELSGGQKQRVAIARALTLNPKILLSDEATSALDPNTTKSILELLQEINAKLGVTIIIVTHEMDVVKKVASRALLLENGKVIGLGRIEELFLKPDEKMMKFLGEDEELPSEGVNIRLFFPSNVSYQPIVTQMARELDLNFNIVWGKLEKLNNHVVGSLVINVDEQTASAVTHYLQTKTEVIWEIL
ncbi:methionine ABC transporter ATP-binding protein [Sulfurospirillum sp. MES]|uniref:methionine ABC transporter ATP-binding protein n=1 Tax=Sulfurospirillum sp. MES TaxID=1565314 RepID=UPI000541DC3C|nr:methionine ABC transporter ATP-binding protein [Sulfurospirillum sp. MES]KHG34927.1 MAG: methionine ABC transporter ATP-binding protein [Sulfurospirillum sp. MES]